MPFGGIHEILILFDHHFVGIKPIPLKYLAVSKKLVQIFCEKGRISGIDEYRKNP
jgi:hypothetical protein